MGNLEREMMKWDNSSVRRSDRLLDQSRALELLRTAEWGVLSMTDIDGSPYGVPLNYVWDGEAALYVHCAPDGRKLRCLDQEPRVSFCIVGKVNLLPSRFTTEYESIVLNGVVTRHLSMEEKHHALELLLEKLSPHDKVVGMKYAAASFHRVEILRLDVVSWSGKCKRVAAAD